MSYLFFSSCGSKSLPFPLRHVSLKSVDTLQYCISKENSVTLTWSLTNIFNEKAFYDGLLLVYIAEESLSMPYCSKCPIKFSRVLEFPVQDKIFQKENKFCLLYEDRIVQNNRYSYKLKIISKEYSIELESNIIDFEYIS